VRQRAKFKKKKKKKETNKMTIKKQTILRVVLLAFAAIAAIMTFMYAVETGSLIGAFEDISDAE